MNQRALLIQHRNANTAGAQVDAERQRCFNVHVKPWRLA